MSRWLLIAGLVVVLMAAFVRAEEAAAAGEEKEKAGEEKEKAEEEVAQTPVPPVATKALRKPRSILQACRKELPTLCKDRKDSMRCLTAKHTEVKDVVCREWLDARAGCNTFLKENKKCAAKENARVCLRNIAKEELPASCSDSEYYKSVKLFGAFRRRASRQPGQQSKAV